ncbi:hypothetical protein [Metabacillus sediminilitoris]|nr:hypothetical protein [Metabacillus sediminilitoris]
MKRVNMNPSQRQTDSNQSKPSLEKQKNVKKRGCGCGKKRRS